MYKVLTSCRSCEYGLVPGFSKNKPTAEKLVEVFDLGIQSLANDFAKPGQEQKGYAPLKVMFCPRCTLAQLSVVVKPEILYANYPYITSRSQTMMEHFNALWSDISTECHPESVVEIGSNDGWFLEYCKASGVSAVMGIDPAENLKPSSDSGIITLTGLFDDQSAAIARASMPYINAIVARHVFAHIDDWQAFIKNLDIMAQKDTLIVIECPYVMDMLEGVEFDTIYHEHLSYISIKSVVYLLRNSPFHLHKVQKYPVHGGAMVLMIRRNDCGIAPHSSVEKFLEKEQVNLEAWNKFDQDAWGKIYELEKFVRSSNSGDPRICGFGASAKSTVWVNACGFNRKEVMFIADSTRQKWGCFSPGSDIPICDEGALLRELPGFAIMFCWNYEQEVLKTQSRYLENGGQFVVPDKAGLRIVGQPRKSEVVNLSIRA